LARFRIYEIHRSSAYTGLPALAYKRQTSNVETNISVSTKDGYMIRVKPSCYTIKRARANQVKAIRSIMNNVIISRAKEMDMEQFVQEIVTGKLSASIYHDVKPIYPLRRWRSERLRSRLNPVQPHNFFINFRSFQLIYIFFDFLVLNPHQHERRCKKEESCKVEQEIYKYFSSDTSSASTGAGRDHARMLPA